jgi:hypothetical protein
MGICARGKSTPIVVAGKVIMPTYDGRVLVLGLA